MFWTYTLSSYQSSLYHQGLYVVQYQQSDSLIAGVYILHFDHYLPLWSVFSPPYIAAFITQKDGILGHFTPYFMQFSLFSLSFLFIYFYLTLFTALFFLLHTSFNSDIYSNPFFGILRAVQMYPIKAQ